MRNLRGKSLSVLFCSVVCEYSLLEYNRMAGWSRVESKVAAAKVEEEEDEEDEDGEEEEESTFMSLFSRVNDSSGCL